MKTGLIMEGGAMRGLYTAGVTDVMMENGIEFDGAIGVSAGAAFGCNYKSRQIGRVIRYNKRFAHEKRFCSLYSLITTGDLYGADFCYRLMPDALDPFDTYTYEHNPMEFYVVCTDMDTGKPVYHRCDTGNSEDIKWMRASASMPIASRPVRIDGMRLLDGGISDSIPVKFFESIGYERNVIILTQPASYRKEKLKLLPLLKMRYPHNREMLADLAKRHKVYNETLEYVSELEREGKAFVVRPAAPLNIGSTEHDTSEMERVYQEGRRVGTYNLAAMKRFLEKAAAEE